MTTATSTGATIEVDGSPLSPEAVERIVDVVVDHDVHLPAAFSIRFSDPGRTATADLPIRISSRVAISGAALGESARRLLEGEVTSVEAEYGAEAGSFLIVRGYDLAHRLHRGRHTRVFSQAKYSDVVRQVARAAGLRTGTVDDSGQVKDHVPQVGQSDWEFLEELADEIDFELGIEDGKLSFHKPTDASKAPPGGNYGSTIPLQLIFGEDLLEFRPRVSAAGQVDSVEVRAWDGARKQAIVGSAQAAASSAGLKDTAASLARALGSARLVSVEPRAIDQASADKRAARIAQLVGTTFAEAVGVVRGNPDIVAGRAISVSVVGGPFVGNYTLTRTRHVFGDRGYRIQFTASGRQDRSLIGLLGNGRHQDRGAAPAAGMTGVVTGVVTDVTDPKKAGRVKLRFEWLSADYVSDWARVAMPGAGKSRGAVWFPEVGDEVLVGFEHGDVRRPIVLGGLWNSQDRPPAFGLPNGKPNARALVSLKGHKLVLHDEDGSEAIELVTAGGISVTLDDHNKTISIKAGGSTKVSIAAGGDVSIAGHGNVEIKADSKLSLSGGSGVELTSRATTVVKGQILQLNPP